jgi:hypothetical protein
VTATTEFAIDHPQAYMDNQKIFTLEVTADELALIERALSGLVPVQVRQPNDTISLLQQQVQNLCPHPDITLPTPNPSIHRAGASCSLSSTRLSTPGTQAHTTAMSPGLPSPSMGDQTLPAEENLQDAAQVTSVTDQWEMLASFGLGSVVNPETNDKM